MLARREAQQAFRIEQPNLLLVEGRDDYHFFSRIIKHREQDRLQVVPYGGKDNLGNFLANILIPALNTSDQVKIIGITRDADQDYSTAFQSIGDSLRRAELPVPTAPVEGAKGSLNGEEILIAAYVLPDNARQGELETLCLDAVREAASMPCIDDLFECLESIDHLPTKQDKARLGTFLSTNTDNPNLLMGQAVDAGVIPWNSPAFTGIHQFLEMLTSVA